MGAMTAAGIIATGLEAFGVTRARLLDHSNRAADEMDARAAIAVALHDRLGYNGRRAAKAVGYSDTTLTVSWDRLRLRVADSPRLKAEIARLWPAPKARAA